MQTPLILLDNAWLGQQSLLRFSRPAAVIAARLVEEIPAAFRAIEAALAAGRHVAGWMSYELGYALEQRLMPLQRDDRKVPLLWFAVFDAPQEIGREELQPGGRAYSGPLRHEWDRCAYGERFRRVHDYIEAGDIYQANLSFRSRFAFAGDPLTLYLQLRDSAAAAHGAYIDDGERQILSLSPELFFAVGSDGKITARPMKGTAPRGSDELSDARAKAALSASAKDRAENLMIVDLLRNDVGRLALIGSVAVPDLFSLETYPTFHTLVSTVTAQLKPATRAEAIVRALFPCGSVTGAPKIRAMEIIRELETSPRGVYCGAIGYFAPDGSANFNVAIRTITIQGEAGELGIGGAIVQDSHCDAEYDECLLKARYFKDARRPIGLFETLRYDGAFVRLDRHLERMRNSAEVLGLPFDRARASAALERAVPGAAAPLRVRLSLDEAGAFNCTSAQVESAPTRWRYAISPFRVNSVDQLLRHKTSWREFFDDERARLAGLTGCDEVIFLNERSELSEGSRTNIFVRRGGKLVTPPLCAGVLNGVLRRELIAEGACSEAVLSVDDLRGDVLLGNSLRGLIPAQAVEASAVSREA
jgi:para-aminobenzoate synthetase/4-amino-4-deoxychorismate lyase